MFQNPILFGFLRSLVKFCQMRETQKIAKAHIFCSLSLKNVKSLFYVVIIFCSQKIFGGFVVYMFVEDVTSL